MIIIYVYFGNSVFRAAKTKYKYDPPSNAKSSEKKFGKLAKVKTKKVNEMFTNYYEISIFNYFEF